MNKLWLKLMNEIIGEQIELNKFDADEASRMSVSGKVIKHFYNQNGSGGFYLLKLDKPFDQRGIDGEHIVFWSPLIQSKESIQESADAFVLLIPNVGYILQERIDEKRFIPFEWVKASRKTHSKNVFPSIEKVITMMHHRAQQISIAYNS